MVAPSRTEMDHTPCYWPIKFITIPRLSMYHDLNAHLKLNSHPNLWLCKCVLIVVLLCLKLAWVAACRRAGSGPTKIRSSGKSIGPISHKSCDASNLGC